MSRVRPFILLTERLSDPAAAWLRERCTLSLANSDDPQFAKELSQADGLIIRTYTIIDAGFLDQAPNLRVIGRAGTGLDNIDVASCRARGIEVVYTPEANTQAVVEYVLCLMCDALRPRMTLTEPVAVAKWNRIRAEMFGKREMSEVTLGILGLGRIGKRLACVAHPLTSNIIYYDLVEIPSHHRQGATPVAVEDLFGHADVVSVHIDGRETNRRFISERLLSRMKPEVVFINTSRGFVVDNLALAAFLQRNTAALAMLDVHDPEPIEADYPLLGLPNARMFPHLASRTSRAMENMSWVVRDVMAVLDGKKPMHPAPAIPDC